ncbi:MAG: hypothetical protein WC428_01645 [Candidatus Paceibacterota bacterium]
MGGKALNRYGVHTERKNTDKFRRIGYELQTRVGEDLGYNTAIITCYRTKADHGDLDLLICVPDKNLINWRNYIENVFKPQAIYSNGGVHSFDYQNFQVDFIPILESKWKSALVYFSYDPLGNIMGKTYHKFNLSYGWEGLFYKYRNFRGTNSKNILLTNDVTKIFEFGGYDYDRYLKGFDTLEEIFKFAIDSKYFDTEMFQMENLKSIDKKRNRKRGSYHLFLQYLKDNNINTKYSFYEQKDLYIIDIDSAFPEANLLDQLHDLQVKDELDQALAEKFNGNVVMQWLPELQGKELGIAMGNFKKTLGNDYVDIISNYPIEDIQDLFMKTYNGEK